MGDSTVQQWELRAENFGRLVKGFALQEMKMKQLVTEETSQANIETYYRETATELTAGTTKNIEGVPRLSKFPYVEVVWQKYSSTLLKYAAEGVVSWEDENLNNIPVLARELLRIGRAVAYKVDTAIYAALLAGKGNTVTITAGYEWNSATIANRDPIQDILNAKKLLYDNNFNPDNGNTYLVINQAEYAYLLGNSKILNNPSFKTADVVSNGVVAQICGLKVLVSPVVTTDTGSLVVIAKECATWKQAMPLTIETIKDPLIKTTIRAAEMGVCQVTTPNCIINITNTAA